jgi:hypothetical protein
MNALSYTQEYFLCAVNEKGNPPALDDTFPACLVAGAVMELLSHGYLTRAEKNKLVVGKVWDDGLPYVRPLYETITSYKKPKDAKGIAEDYLMGLSTKSFNELFAAIGISLVKAECADELTVQGLLKEKIKYVPKAEAVTRIIEKVRAEFLEDGLVTDETLCLTALLDKSALLRNYFSKVEKETLKKRIKEVRQSEASASIREMLDYIDELMAALIIVIGIPH